MIVNLNEAIEAAEFSGLSHLDPALIEYNSTQVAVTTIKHCAWQQKRHRDKLDNMYLFMTTRYLITLLKFRGFFFNLFWNIFPVCTGGKTCKSNQILTLQCNLERLNLWKADQKDLCGECGDF